MISIRHFISSVPESVPENLVPDFLVSMASIIQFLKTVCAEAESAGGALYILLPHSTLHTYTHIHTYILLQITLFIVRKLFPLFSKL